ncbi:MAG: hypothetical protein R6X18_13710 [Chloroflexota bacterium]
MFEKKIGDRRATNTPADAGQVLLDRFILIRKIENSKSAAIWPATGSYTDSCFFQKR